MFDPNRPHGLDDLIKGLYRYEDRAEHGRWVWSVEDLQRVRAYVGNDVWSDAREAHGNDYSVAFMILHHLDLVDRRRVETTPYTAIACEAHNAVVGQPCIGPDDPSYPTHFDRRLPCIPSACTWRILAKHDRIAAMSLFEKRDTDHMNLRGIIPISVDVDDVGVASARAQWRQPPQLTDGQVIVSQASDWTIDDIRIDGTSVMAPHHSLPGCLFGTNRVIGPPLWLPVIKQDQWIDIDVRRGIGGASGFYASIIGSHS